MVYISTLLKQFFYLSAIVILLPICYFLLAYGMSLFPTQNTIHKSLNSRTIYVFYDEMHSDIVLNLKETIEPWEKHLPSLITQKKGYIAFGWGDKETYLNTPTWDDLKISTALKALFYTTPSLMHVNYYPHIHHLRQLKAVELTAEQQKTLEETIFKSFNLQGPYYAGYHQNDQFYSSPYGYNLINTCNTWTGDVLREANISVSYWTPLSHNVIDSLP